MPQLRAHYDNGLLNCDTVYFNRQVPRFRKNLLPPSTLKIWAETFFEITFKWNQQTHSFPNLFLYKILHVSGNSSTHHQELATVHSALAHIIQVWRQLACRIILIPQASCHQTCIICASAECTSWNFNSGNYLFTTDTK